MQFIAASIAAGIAALGASIGNGMVSARHLKVWRVSQKWPGPCVVRCSSVLA